MLRLIVPVALPTVATLVLVAGGDVSRPTAPAQQLVAQQPRPVQTISVTIFRDRWDALAEQATAPPSIGSRPEKTVAASPRLVEIAEDLPSQTELAPPPRERAARPRELCARHSLRRVEYRRGGHLYWRCAQNNSA
jgi:hypothetical protein